MKAPRLFLLKYPIIFDTILPMIQKKKISLIIPCKNEEAALFSMLQHVPSCVDEVIVVDNGSVDNTQIVAKENGARVVVEKRHINGVGYGYAHQKGMAYATGDIIVAMDGDNTYPLSAIKNAVLYLLKSKSDFISCARFPLENTHAISFTRQLGIHILNMTVSLFYGFHIKDILSGMWVMTKEAAQELDASNGEWNFSPEIKLAALTHPTLHFSELHISHDVRTNGLSKQNIWKTGFNHLFYIIRRRFTTDKGYSNTFEAVGKGLQAIAQYSFSAIGVR